MIVALNYSIVYPLKHVTRLFLKNMRNMAKAEALELRALVFTWKTNQWYMFMNRVPDLHTAEYIIKTTNNGLQRI